MAPRIPVVFSQAAGLTPQQRDHEETLIAEMLMEDRIEVSLIGAMEHLDEEDTDRLCLMGFQGDFILLSSLESAAAFKELERLEVEGRQGKTMFEPSADLRADQTRRKIYHIPVVEHGRGDVRQEVRRLREDAQIATIPLLGIDGATPLATSATTGTPKTGTPSPTAKTVPSNPQETVSAEPASAEPASKAPVSSTAAAPGDSSSPGATPAASSSAAPKNQATQDSGFDQWEDDELDAQLDSLVDELDEMDL